MATIMQPYNPWREQLAAGILGPIIGNVIQRSQEANQNRKFNALVGKTLEDLAAEGSQGGGLMNAPAMPVGYNDNGWAKAFHDNYTPFTQFDMGTASVAPTPTQAQPSVPDTQAFRNAILANLGTKRFSMLNPAFVEQNMTPFYQSMEQARQEAMKQAADAYMNAPDGQGKFDQLINGATQGYIDPNIIASFEKFHEYNNPYKQPYKFDTGATTQYGSFNPASGEYIQSGEFKNSLKPSEIAEIGLRREEEAGRNARNYSELNEKRRQFDINMKNNNYWKGLEWDDNQNSYSNILSGEDGSQYMVDRRGNTKKLDLGSSNENASMRLTPDEKYRLDNLQTQYQELNKERQEYIKKKAEIAKAASENLTFGGEGD